MRGKGITHFLLGAVGHRNAFLLFAIVCTLSVLDLAGIAIIFPFLQIVTQPTVAVNALTKIGFENAELPMHEQLVAVLGVGLILFYTAKTILQSMLLRVQVKRLAGFTAEMTNDIVSHILSARYAIFQSTAASEIASTAYSNTVHATLALTALIQAINEALVLALLFCGFLVFQPVLALGSLVLVAFASLVLYLLVIRRSAQLGAAQSNIENVRYRLLFSIASAIRDIKIMGLDRLFDTRNRHVSRDYSELAWRYNFNAGLPRLIIELLALLSIVGASLIVVIFRIPLETAGPLLGVVAVATVRAVPAFSRLFGAIGAFRFSRQFVLQLIALKEKLADASVLRKDVAMDFRRVIELQNVGFCYGERRVLKNVCLRLKRGESIGIVGSSGSGKTTLLDLFTGLQPATEGNFLCDGVKFDPFTSIAIQKIIGYVPQSITLLDDTIAFNVSFDETPDDDKVMRALDIANLHELITSLPDGIQTRVGENGLRLSGGQRQRIGIARALYRSPEILVFDEATSSLDTISEKELSSEIETLRGRISVLIVAHRLSTVSGCDRIYVLTNGVIEASGTHAELLQISDTYKKLHAIQREDDSE